MDLDRELQLGGYPWNRVTVDPLDTQDVIEQTSVHLQTRHPFSRGAVDHNHCGRGTCYCNALNQTDVTNDTWKYTLRADVIRNALIDIVRMRGLLSVLGPVIALNFTLVIESLKKFVAAIPSRDDPRRNEFWSLPNALGALFNIRAIDVGGTVNFLSLGIRSGGEWPLPSMAQAYPTIRAMFPRLSITSAAVQALLDNLVIHTPAGSRSYFINVALSTLYALWFAMKDYRFLPSPTEHAQHIPVRLTINMLNALKDTWRTGTELLKIVNDAATARVGGFRVNYRFIIRLNDVSFRESCGALAFMRGNIRDIRNNESLHPLLRFFCLGEVNSLALVRELRPKRRMIFYVTFTDITTGERIFLEEELIPQVTVKIGIAHEELSRLTGEGSEWDIRMRLLRQRNIDNIVRYIGHCYGSHNWNGEMMIDKYIVRPIT